MFAAMLLGAAVLYIPGLVWLGGWLVINGMDATSAITVALTSGMLPFIPGDIIKAVLAALAFPAAFSHCWAEVDYTRNGRSERIRTSDPLLPKQVRYQTALHSDNCDPLIVTGKSLCKLLRGQVARL